MTLSCSDGDGDGDGIGRVSLHWRSLVLFENVCLYSCYFCTGSRGMSGDSQVYIQRKHGNFAWSSEDGCGVLVKVGSLVTDEEKFGVTYPRM